MTRTRPERAYALLVEANPVPAPTEALATRPTEHLRVVSASPPAPHATGHSRVSSWLKPLVVAAAGLIMIVATLRLTGGDEMRLTAPPGATAEEDALFRAEQYFRAISEDRAAAIPTLFGAGSEADLLMWEMNAVMSRAGFPQELESCEVTSSIGTIVSVKCTVTMHDPVFAAVGAGQLDFPFQLRDGIMVWQRATGAGIGRANNAYSDYLRTFLPVRYDQVCDPAGYPKTINHDGGIALTPECGALMAASSEDAAAWITSGRQPPGG